MSASATYDLAIPGVVCVALFTDMRFPTEECLSIADARQLRDELIRILAEIDNDKPVEGKN